MRGCRHFDREGWIGAPGVGASASTDAAACASRASGGCPSRLRQHSTLAQGRAGRQPDIAHLRGLDHQLPHRRRVQETVVQDREAPVGAGGQGPRVRRGGEADCSRRVGGKVDEESDEGLKM